MVPMPARNTQGPSSETALLENSKECHISLREVPYCIPVVAYGLGPLIYGIKPMTPEQVNQERVLGKMDVGECAKPLYSSGPWIRHL